MSSMGATSRATAGKSASGDAIAVPVSSNRSTAGQRRMVGATLAATTRQPAPERRSEEHTSELQSRRDLVCRLLLEKKKKRKQSHTKEKPTNRTRPVKTR